MAVEKTRGHVLIVLILVSLAGALFALPSRAVTRAEVDEACSESRQQLAEYRAAREAFEEAAHGYEDALERVDAIIAKQDRIQGSVDNHSEQLDVIQAQIEEQAVELYMLGGLATPSVILSASSIDEFLATSEFLTAAAIGGQQSIDDLIAARSELGRFQEDLAQTRVDLQQAQSDALGLREIQQTAMVAEQETYSVLYGECRTLLRAYEKQLAEERARAAQRAAGSVQVGSFICPFTPGRSSFVDSWGAPRSGGRTHKGTDMFAPWNEPMYAVADGVAYTRNYGLGGLAIWLIADNGVGYYYAHLNSFNVSDRQRVTQGQTIGFNGDSGNARGGAPHLHFEIHPGGRGAPAVNPYPTLVDACR